MPVEPSLYSSGFRVSWPKGGKMGTSYREPQERRNMKGKCLPGSVYCHYIPTVGFWGSRIRVWDLGERDDPA